MSKKKKEFSQKELKAFIENKHSCVKLHKSIYNLTLYPYHLSDLSSSIRKLLTAKFASYDKELGGILLGYKNVKILTPQGSIVTDSCYIYLNIQADFYIFQPEISATLTGIVNKISDDHVGCLVHRVFNVSVPVPYHCEEDWLGYNVQIGQKALLRVVHIDLDGRLPYIRAKFISTFDEDSKDLKQNKKNKTPKNSSISENINNINISGITEIELTTIKKKKKKSKKHSLDKNNDFDQLEFLNSTPHNDNETPKHKNKKSKRKSSETRGNIDKNQTFNSTTSNSIIDTSIERKKSKKSLDITENHEAPNDDKDNKFNSFITDTNSTKEIKKETTKKKKHKESRTSVDTTENVETIESISKVLNNKTPKDKKSRKSFETSNNGDKSQNLSSTSEILSNATPKKVKGKKSFETIDNFAESTSLKSKEILNMETPKEKKKKSRKSLESIDRRKNSEYDLNINLDVSAEQNSSKKKKKHKDKSGLGKGDNVEELNKIGLIAEQLTDSLETSKQTKKTKSTKRNSKTLGTSENLQQESENEKFTPAVKNRNSDQQDLWENIVKQMYDSDLERTLDNSSKKLHTSDTTNDSIQNTETPKSKKRKRSFSEFEDSGIKTQKFKHSISEFQETGEPIIGSSKKKHKSQKKIN